MANAYYNSLDDKVAHKFEMTESEERNFETFARLLATEILISACNDYRNILTACKENQEDGFEDDEMEVTKKQYGAFFGSPLYDFYERIRVKDDSLADDIIITGSGKRYASTTRKSEYRNGEYVRRMVEKSVGV